MSANWSSKILLVAMIVVASLVGFGQDTKEGEAKPDVQQAPPTAQNVRGNMLRQLGLTRDQIQQIRRMNQERKPLMQAAQRRFREANRALDEAIYADQVNDGDIEARLKQVQMAQAEIQRVRYMNELAVRRILTPEQLMQFREMRERFEQARENLEKGRPSGNQRQIDRRGQENDLRRPAIDRPAAHPVQQKAAPQKPNE